MFQERRYQFSDLDDTENVELYRPGGLHPVRIGDVFANGSYKVLHKLGHGGSSTVWLARDQRPQSSVSATLVALKILSADQSCKPKDEIPDLVFPPKLGAFASASHSPARDNVLTLKDDFMEEGPNGMHLCTVSQLAGPSVASVSLWNKLGWEQAAARRSGEEGSKANRGRGRAHAFCWNCSRRFVILI
jgi:serine/threonine-protein kinase SRPK3